MDSAAGSCNACGATGTALMKLSLGKDFFGRTYDRLSPSTDQSPKWYCESCSMQKNLQRDFRDISAEIDKLVAGQTSELSKSDEFQRADVAAERDRRPARCRTEAFTSACERRGHTITRTTQYHHAFQPRPRIDHVWLQTPHFRLYESTEPRRSPWELLQARI